MTISDKVQKKLEESMKVFKLLEEKEKKINSRRYEVLHIVACPEEFAGILHEEDNKLVKVATASLGSFRITTPYKEALSKY